MSKCRTCDRTLIPRTTWTRLTREQRRVIRATAARYYSPGLCNGCAAPPKRRRVVESADLAYTGGWVRDGLIQRPAGRVA